MGYDVVNTGNGYVPFTSILPAGVHRARVLMPWTVISQAAGKSKMTGLGNLQFFSFGDEGSAKSRPTHCKLVLCWLDKNDNAKCYNSLSLVWDFYGYGMGIPCCDSTELPKMGDWLQINIYLFWIPSFRLSTMWGPLVTNRLTNTIN